MWDAISGVEQMNIGRLFPSRHFDMLLITWTMSSFRKHHSFYNIHLFPAVPCQKCLRWQSRPMFICSTPLMTSHMLSAWRVFLVFLFREETSHPPKTEEQTTDKYNFIMSYNGFDTGWPNVASDCLVRVFLLLKDTVAKMQDEPNINPFVWHGL